MGGLTDHEHHNLADASLEASSGNEGDGSEKKVPKRIWTSDFMDPNPFFPKIVERYFSDVPLLGNLLIALGGDAVAMAFIYIAQNFIGEILASIIGAIVGLVFTADCWARYNVAMGRFYSAKREGK